MGLATAACSQDKHYKFLYIKSQHKLSFMPDGFSNAASRRRISAELPISLPSTMIILKTPWMKCVFQSTFHITYVHVL